MAGAGEGRKRPNRPTNCHKGTILRTATKALFGALVGGAFLKIRCSVVPLTTPPAGPPLGPLPRTQLPVRHIAHQRGPKHTARKQHPASPPTGCAVGSGQNPLPGGCMLISLCSSTTKKRVSNYSGSIDSSRRVLLVPCLAAQITRAPANRGLSKSCDAPSAPSN